MGQGGVLGTAAYTPASAYQTPITFGTGFTNTSGTITDNLGTGLSGGQAVIGGTNAGENLILTSTSNATKGKILFGTSVYDEVNNFLGIGTNSPAATLDVQGNASVTGNPTFNYGTSLFPVQSFGDSITVGTGATNPATTAYIPLLASATGWVFSNHAASSNMVPDQAVQVYAVPTLPQSISTIMIGTNDQDVYGTNTTKLASFQSGDEALLAWLAIPNSQKIFGTSSAVTYTGTWLNFSNVYPGIPKTSAVTNSTATFTVTGQNVLVDMLQSDGSTGTYTISIDGVSQGNFTVAPPAAMGSQLGINYGPGLHVFKNLSNTSHTVVITATNSGSVTFDWAAGIVNGSSLGPTVYASNTLYQTAASYAMYGTSTANTDTYNTTIAANISELAAMGLNIKLVDSNAAVDPNTQLSDGKHPNDSGHQAIANAFLSVIGTIPSTTSSNLFSVYSNTNANSFFLGKNTSAGSSATAGIQLQNDTADSAYIYRTSSGYSLGQTPGSLYLVNTNGDIVFNTGLYERLRIAGPTGYIGIATAAPTHTLTLGQASTGIASYNTLTQTTNYERVHEYWNNNVYTFASEAAGTGTARNFSFMGASVGVGTVSPTAEFSIGGNRNAAAWGVNGAAFQTLPAFYTDTSSSGTVGGVTAANSFAVPVFAASTTTAYTNATNLYIAGAPAAGTNTTITKGYGIHVAGGGGLSSQEG